VNESTPTLAADVNVVGEGGARSRWEKSAETHAIREKRRREENEQMATLVPTAELLAQHRESVPDSAAAAARHGAGCARRA
jgi:hypothetical protein